MFLQYLPRIWQYLNFTSGRMLNFPLFFCYRSLYSCHQCECCSSIREQCVICCVMWNSGVVPITITWQMKTITTDSQPGEHAFPISQVPTTASFSWQYKYFCQKMGLWSKVHLWKGFSLLVFKERRSLTKGRFSSSACFHLENLELYSYIIYNSTWRKSHPKMYMTEMSQFECVSSYLPFLYIFIIHAK